jgi:hypothetical protein
VLEAGDANLNDPDLREYRHEFMSYMRVTDTMIAHSTDIVRPASYGSHFGKSSYDWAHKTVRALPELV